MLPVSFETGLLSILPANCNNCSFSYSTLKLYIFDIFNFPYVNVPVLSNTIVSTFCAFSNISLFFIKIPFEAHFPSLTTIASGVANPKLHGHATTNIVTNVVIAVGISFPIIIYPKKDKIAIIITAGTKYPATLSAIFAIGAFVLLASTTSLTISDTVESLPIFSALYSIYPS